MMSNWCPMVVINSMNACSGETGMPKEKKHKAKTSIPGSFHLFSFLFQLARRAPTSLEADAGQIRCSLDSGRSCCSLKIVTAVIPQSMAQTLSSEPFSPVHGILRTGERNSMKHVLSWHTIMSWLNISLSEKIRSWMCYENVWSRMWTRQKAGKHIVGT